MKRNSQRGVALVITLIMLSIITFLAVAFLATSRRNQSQVNVAQQQTTSRYIADAAAARAQSEIVARIMAHTNAGVVELDVSKNFINQNGFTNSTVVDTNNVNYDRTSTGNPLSDAQRIQNIANLYFDPRPPVYIATNDSGSNDFRFYLDFNRNGKFDSNGILPVIINEAGQTNGNYASFVGDPEWIGVLEKPELPHSPTNRFIGRYAYLIFPIGKSLDLNYIHNYAKGNSPATLANGMNAGDGFWRNQGVGSWEINLAAFLKDLNNNIYATNGYVYRTNSVANQGAAFDDALSILSYRHRTDRGVAASSRFSSQSSVRDLFGTAGANAFQTDFIDGYANGPLMTSYQSLTNDNDISTEPWSGSQNTNHFFDIQELFDPNKTSPNFVNRLRGALVKSNSYDRYTFQRLMGQLGVDPVPERDTRMNVNYDNLVQTDASHPVPNATNFFNWRPVDFFTNAVNRMLATYGYKFTATNIPIYHPDFTSPTNYPTNRYTVDINRILQLAANMYEATSGKTGTNAYYPTVFRPLFDTRGQTNLIVGYEEFVEDPLSLWNDPWKDVSTNSLNLRDNVYGIPLIIGARKFIPEGATTATGYPNFNEFSLQTVVQTSRRIQLVKPVAGAPTIKETNQMYLLSISNSFGLEAWNSYLTAYPRPVTLYASNEMILTLTNETGLVLLSKSAGFATNLLIPNWKGSGSSNSFQVVLTNNLVVLSNAQYVASPTPSFRILKSGETNKFESGDSGGAFFYSPQWHLQVTNRVRYMLVDGGRVIDFVSLGQADEAIDVFTDKDSNPPVSASIVNSMWNTNRLGGSGPKSIRDITEGMEHQIKVSYGIDVVDDDVWDNYSAGASSKDDSIIKFREFVSAITTTNADLEMQVPYTPIKSFAQFRAWQANDPLVHYTITDLTDFSPSSQNATTNPVNTAIIPNISSFINLGKPNTRYSPWLVGGNYNLNRQDPQIKKSDDWNFPTNKLPGIGWLGRIHRGTPWQTVYMKSSIISDVKPSFEWSRWSGSSLTHPINDWKLFDLFTTSPNENAGRGLLSVNQGNFAAWSAVLSGVLVVSNKASSMFLNANSALQFDVRTNEPTSRQLTNIFNDISVLRQSKVAQSGMFNGIGEILGAPALSANSPFLNLEANQLTHGLNDEAYERIPQQIMSLLKLGGTRYVVYSYGQSLKPAPNSIVLNPPTPALFNLCTNYQITGEVVTRTVLRVDDATSTKPRTVIESYNVLPENY